MKDELLKKLRTLRAEKREQLQRKSERHILEIYRENFLAKENENFDAAKILEIELEVELFFSEKRIFEEIEFLDLQISKLEKL